MKTKVQVSVNLAYSWFSWVGSCPVAVDCGGLRMCVCRREKRTYIKVNENINYLVFASLSHVLLTRLIAGAGGEATWRKEEKEKREEKG